MNKEGCDNHPRREAVVRCASCRRRLCDACWLRKVEDEPWCERCIHYLSSTGANVALGVAFFLCTLAVTWAVVRVWPMDDAHTVGLGVVSVVAGLIVSAFIGSRSPPVDPRRITERLPEEVPPPRAKSVRGHPYRVALRRATRVVAAPVSGLKVAGLVLLAMLAVALALPNLLHLRRIVEFELVAVGFWLLWGVTGSVLLYRSALAAVANDDHDCQGSLKRSLVWGFLWSSVYVVPLLGTLAVVHWFYR